MARHDAAGVLEVDDDVPGSDEARDDELAGGSDCDEPTVVVCPRSSTAATISPPRSTTTSVPTTTRSRTAPGIGTASQIALTAATSFESESFASPKNNVVFGW